MWTRVRVEIAAAFDEHATELGDTRSDRIKALVTADADGLVTIKTNAAKGE